MPAVFIHFLPHFLILFSITGIVYLFVSKNPSDDFFRIKYKLLVLARQTIRFCRIYILKSIRFCKSYFIKSKSIAKSIKIRTEPSRNNKHNSQILLLHKQKIQEERAKRLAEIKQKKLQAINALAQEQDYIQMIAKNPKDVFAYKQLAKLYWNNNDKKHAIMCWKQILKIEPLNTDAQSALSSIEE